MKTLSTACERDTLSYDNECFGGEVRSGFNLAERYAS